LLFTIGLLIKIDSKGHVFYTQTRVGRNYKNFKIIKFRTMLEQSGLNITSKDDNRITRIGRYLRTMKLDELPQLINVLLGDMSLVGPRPEIPEYVNEFILYNSVLTVRPGITDYASIKYKNEEEILFKAKKNGMDMIEYYKEVILFDKIKLNLKYIKQKSLTIDLFIIIKTLMCLRKG
jgi:lipopolysaccharide/colanic/teichoic acid biosynthesis glycosyltransferase